METRLRTWARGRGYEVAWGLSAAVGKAVAALRGRHEKGELDEAFFATELQALAEAKMPPQWTAVVVAVPRPAHLVRFELEDGSLEALLPPTYLRYRAFFEEVRQELARDALPGARVEYLTAPIKSVAARLGLVRYGRNNVTYTQGAGSFTQLCGFMTDAVLPMEGAGTGCEPALLEECEGCGVCAGVCPTGAIGDERVLLSGHRCLTLANELPGEWPEWAPAWAHTCLVGCLECQQACPANPRLGVEESGIAFSAAETRALLGGGSRPSGNAEDGIRIKLAWLGQPGLEEVLGRNLRALLEAPAARKR